MDLYDINHNEWIKLPDMPGKIHFPGIITLNGKIYLAGGSFGLNRFSGHQKTLYEYIPAKQKHPYASDEPMPVPMLFEIPGVTSPWHITFEPDGNTFYFLADSNDMEIVKFCHFENGEWSYPQTAIFSGKYRIETPNISPDGNKFFFTYAESGKENIYVINKSDSGWNNPIDMGTPINSPYFDSSPTVTLNGNLYFGSARTGRFQYYCSQLINGNYATPERLDNSINQYNLLEFFISPDENYLLFGRYISETNYSDIYIAFKNGDQWTTPLNLGPKINNSISDSRPCISPDGNYLFFSASGGIYQVDWKPMLDSLRNISLPTEVGNPNKFYPEEFHAQSKLS